MKYDPTSDRHCKACHHNVPHDLRTYLKKHVCRAGDCPCTEGVRCQTDVDQPAEVSHA